MAATGSGYADRNAHIKALMAQGMAQGMTARQARVAEVRAMVAEGARRRSAARQREQRGGAPTEGAATRFGAPSAQQQQSARSTPS